MPWDRVRKLPCHLVTHPSPLSSRELRGSQGFIPVWLTGIAGCHERTAASDQNQGAFFKKEKGDFTATTLR